MKKEVPQEKRLKQHGLGVTMPPINLIYNIIINIKEGGGGMLLFDHVKQEVLPEKNWNQRLSNNKNRRHSEEKMKPEARQEKKLMR